MRAKGEEWSRPGRPAGQKVEAENTGGSGQHSGQHGGPCWESWGECSLMFAACSVGQGRPFYLDDLAQMPYHGHEKLPVEVGVYSTCCCCFRRVGETIHCSRGVSWDPAVSRVDLGSSGLN